METKEREVTRLGATFHRRARITEMQLLINIDALT